MDAKSSMFAFISRHLDRHQKDSLDVSQNTNILKKMKKTSSEPPLEFAPKATASNSMSLEDQVEHL